MNELSKHIIALFAITIILQSCYTKRENMRLLEKRVPEYEKANYEAYTIQVNDELTMRIISIEDDIAQLFGSNTNNTQQNGNVYRVFQDSTIDIPFANRIKVAGLTLRQAQQRIKEQLSSFGELDVRLAFVNNSFTIIGESSRGVFNIDKDKITIFEALAMAGNIKITGDHKNVHLIRETAEGPKIFTFDIRSKDIIDSEFYYIQPNDIIYIDKKKSSFFKVQSYSSVLGVISSVITFSLTIWNLVLSYGNMLKK